MSIEPDKIFTAGYRFDGWPNCPGCGQDELFCDSIPHNLTDRPTLENYLAAGLKCYACGWSYTPPEPEASAVQNVNSRLLLDYASQAGSLRGRCDIRVSQLPDGRALIIATERDDNNGASVTNAAEIIATLVCAQFKIAPEQMVYIEHYPPSALHGPIPEWDLVTFKGRKNGANVTIGEPNWRPVTRDEMHEIGISDPRVFPLEVDTSEDDTGPVFYTIYDNRKAAQANNVRLTPEQLAPPPVLVWYSTHPAHHGAAAYARAHDRQSALYRGKVPPVPDVLNVGDEVCFIFRPGGKLACGRGKLVEIRTDVGNGFRVELASAYLGTAAPLAPICTLGFPREQLSAVRT